MISGLLAAFRVALEVYREREALARVAREVRLEATYVPGEPYGAGPSQPLGPADVKRQNDAAHGPFHK